MYIILPVNSNTYQYKMVTLAWLVYVCSQKSHLSNQHGVSYLLASQMSSELLPWTSQPSIVAIQVGHISHLLQMINSQHSSSSCKGTSGLLHIMGSNTMIFAVLKAWLMSPLHCVINWEVFFTSITIYAPMGSVVLHREITLCLCARAVTHTYRYINPIRAGCVHL